MKVATTIHRLHPKNLFTLSRGSKDYVDNVFLQLTDANGIMGLGEASPNSFYQETPTRIIEAIHRAKPFISSLGQLDYASDQMPEITGQIWKYAYPSRAAQCAIDLALWDLLAKRQNKSVCELVWNHGPAPISTFFTIAICDPMDLPVRVRETVQAQFLKVKVGSHTDPRILDIIQESSTTRRAIDANGGFQPANFDRLLKIIHHQNLEFIEQPFSPEHDRQINQLRNQTNLPLLADESCVTLQDVERACENFDGFNIKLVKCGGLTNGLAMLEQGIQHKKITMVGCMLESSLSIAAGMVLAQKTNYADLDGSWLISDDPATGLTLKEGFLHPAIDLAGYGVQLRFC